MDIHNIPIAKITEQYLDYLHQLEKLDIDVSADFIYMAATLIHIKSKMLLPVDPLLAAEEQDPRDELVHRLLEHEKFKNAAQLLYQKQQVEANVWSHPDKSLYGGDEVHGELVVSLVDLVKTFQQVLERRKEVPQFGLRHDTVSIAQMMDRLRQRLVVTDDPVSLIVFFETCETRNAMIVGDYQALAEAVHHLRDGDGVVAEAELRDFFAAFENLLKGFDEVNQRND